MNAGPIIIVDDDRDDFEILNEAILEIGVTNEVKWFSSCPDCLDFLKSFDENPFLILSDVNLPIMSGIDLKMEIDSTPELRQRSIPFILYTTSADQIIVDLAYSKMTVQGFFKKPSDYATIKRTLETIISYWGLCCHPGETK